MRAEQKLTIVVVVESEFIFYQYSEMYAQFYYIFKIVLKVIFEVKLLVNYVINIDFWYCCVYLWRKVN